MVIVVRVGLGLAYEGPGMRRGRGYAKNWPDKEGIHHLSTFHAAEGEASQTKNEEGDMERSVEYSLGSKTQVGTVGGDHAKVNTVDRNAAWPNQ